jgi:hypothetical protein
VMLSTTFLTPGEPHAVCVANSRSDQLWALPDNVTPCEAAYGDS